LEVGVLHLFPLPLGERAEVRGLSPFLLSPWGEGGGEGV